MDEPCQIEVAAANGKYIHVVLEPVYDIPKSVVEDVLHSVGA